MKRFSNWRVGTETSRRWMLLDQRDKPKDTRMAQGGDPEEPSGCCGCYGCLLGKAQLQAKKNSAIIFPREFSRPCTVTAMMGCCRVNVGKKLILLAAHDQEKVFLIFLFFSEYSYQSQQEADLRRRAFVVSPRPNRSSPGRWLCCVSFLHLSSTHYLVEVFFIISSQYLRGHSVSRISGYGFDQITMWRLALD